MPILKIGFKAGKETFQELAAAAKTFQRALNAEGRAAAAQSVVGPAMEGAHDVAIATKALIEGGEAKVKQATDFIRTNANNLQQEGKTAAKVLQEAVEEFSGWSMPEGGRMINNRWYTKHALERMAPDTIQVRAILERRALNRGFIPDTTDFIKYVDPRGIPPSIVEDIIQNGKKSVGKTIETLQFENNQLKVIIGEQSNALITVIPK